MKTTNAYRWTILGLGTFCILTYGVIFQSIPPLIGILVEILNVSYARAGALMGLFILPAIFLSIPGGMLTDRFGPRNSYWIIAIGRLVAGIGAAVLLVVAPKIITSWFYDREIGLAMGIFNISMPLGTILSLNFMGAIAFRFLLILWAPSHSVSTGRHQYGLVFAWGLQRCVFSWYYTAAKAAVGK
jgi:MFS family permease